MWQQLTNAKVKIESQDPELRWLTERGGRVFIFGTYGDTQHFRYGFYYLYSVDLTIMYAELYILGASLLSNVPMPLLVTIDAVINLRSMKKVTDRTNKKNYELQVVVSSRTLKITHQLLSLFISQVDLFFRKNMQIALYHSWMLPWLAWFCRFHCYFSLWWSTFTNFTNSVSSYCDYLSRYWYA